MISGFFSKTYGYCMLESELIIFENLVVSGLLRNGDFDLLTFSFVVRPLLSGWLWGDLMSIDD